MMLKWFRNKSVAAEGNEPAEALEESCPGRPANEEPEENRVGFFKRLKERLVKTRETLVSRVDTLVLGKKEIDEDLLDELEDDPLPRIC
jgi:fused signal recognition particle receptor